LEASLILKIPAFRNIINPHLKLLNMAEQSLLTSGYAEASGCIVSPLHFLATLQMVPTGQRMS